MNMIEVAAHAVYQVLLDATQPMHMQAIGSRLRSSPEFVFYGARALVEAKLVNVTQARYALLPNGMLDEPRVSGPHVLIPVLEVNTEHEDFLNT